MYCKVRRGSLGDMWDDFGYVWAHRTPGWCKCTGDFFCEFNQPRMFESTYLPPLTDPARTQTRTAVAVSGPLDAKGKDAQQCALLCIRHARKAIPAG